VRLFVAVSPPREVLALVEALPRPELPSLRWTTAEQWHVTLRFLGEVDDPEEVAGALREVPALLRDAGAHDFEAVLGPAVAWFPGRRILQVPVSGIDLLAHSVSDATASFAPVPDSTGFSGHLTLARVRGRGRGPVNLAGTPIKAVWEVDEVSLLSSSLGAGGARYSVVERVRLSLREEGSPGPHPNARS
jgi:2'-5' RNA ligase